MVRLEDLSGDVLGMIFARCDVNSKFNLAFTCKKMRAVGERHISVAERLIYFSRILYSSAREKRCLETHVCENWFSATELSRYFFVQPRFFYEHIKEIWCICPDTHVCYACSQGETCSDNVLYVAPVYFNLRSASVAVARHYGGDIRGWLKRRDRRLFGVRAMRRNAVKKFFAEQGIACRGNKAAMRRLERILHRGKAEDVRAEKEELVRGLTTGAKRRRFLHGQLRNVGWRGHFITGGLYNDAAYRAYVDGGKIAGEDSDWPPD